MRMRRIISSSVALSGSTIFFHIISQTARYSEKIIERKTCDLIFCTTFAWNISHPKKNSARYYHKCNSCNVPVILVILQSNLNFLERFSRNPQIPNFVKIRPLGDELFHVDRQTDGRTYRHDDASSRFSQLCERAWKSNTLTTKLRVKKIRRVFVYNLRIATRYLRM
jgi:hypothetical protein